MMTPPLLPTLVFFGATALAAAQTQSIPVSERFDSPLADASFGKVIAGEFNGDLSLDAVALDGSQPVLMISPEVFDSAVRLNVTANDIATLSGLLSGKDLLVTVGPNGLELHERNSALLQWNPAQVVAGPQSAWANAIAVEVGDVDGDGDQDLVGLSSNGQTVLVELQTGTGVFSAGSSFTCAAGAYGLVLLNWTEQPSASGSKEIAVLSAGALGIYDSAGTMLTSGAAFGPMLACTVDESSNASYEQKLAVVSKVAGRDWLSLLGESVTEGPFDLGPATVVSVAAGDVDSDSGSELFFGVDSMTSLVMLDYDSSNAPTYDVTQPEFFAFGDAGRDPAWNQAGLAVGDFDDDGIDDVLAPAQGDLSTANDPPSSIRLINVSRRLDTGWWSDLRVSISSVVYTLAGDLIIDFVEPPTALYDPTHQVKLEVSVWHTTGFGNPTNPIPFQSRQLIPLPTGGQAESFTLTPPGYYQPGSPGSPDLFTIVARQVIVDSNDEVFEIGPAWTGINASEWYWLAISTAPDVEASIATHPDLGVGIPDPGGIGTGPRVPPTGDGEEPQPSNP